jgi:CRP/FNR family transcriptional regulator, cyclic AMP receptor protein
MSDEVILKTIQGWKWFAYVPVEAKQWLAARASLRQIPKGTTVYAPGDPIRHVFGVVNGVFRLYFITHRGDEMTMEEIVAGGWFSHNSPHADAPQLLHCVCHQSATVVAVPYAVMLEFAERWPTYYKGLYDEFTSRAVAVFARLELLSLHNLFVRLAVYFMRMAHLRGVKKDDGSLWIAAGDSQAEIGSRVGATRQRINTVIKSWTRRGIIEMEKEGIRVLNLDALRAEATRTGFDLDGYLAAWHYGWQGGAR